MTSHIFSLLEPLRLVFAGGKAKKAFVALLSALPFVISAIAILANAHHSKLTGEAFSVSATVAT
jgi:hypothetical protein